MRCCWVRKHLSSFLDGELDGRKRREVKAHLKGCSPCSRERELLRSTWEVLGEWKDIEPSFHFKTNFWRRVGEQESSQRRPSFYPRLSPRWAAALVTAAILVASLSLYFSPRPGRGVHLPASVREELALVVPEEWEADWEEIAAEGLSEEEWDELIQAVITPAMRGEAEALDLALAEGEEIYPGEVMETLFELGFAEEIILVIERI